MGTEVYPTTLSDACRPRVGFSLTYYVCSIERVTVVWNRREASDLVLWVRIKLIWGNMAAWCSNWRSACIVKYGSYYTAWATYAVYLVYSEHLHTDVKPTLSEFSCVGRS